VTGDIGLQSLRLYSIETALFKMPGTMDLKASGFIAMNLLHD
jgi:hypothetical protein